jgi:hypothetical protein
VKLIILKIIFIVLNERQPTDKGGSMFWIGGAELSEASIAF